MRILFDLQALQTPGAATRGVGKYTNGLLKALAARHEVVGFKRPGGFLVEPAAAVPLVETIVPCDLILNCAGPFWDVNLLLAPAEGPDRPLTASIFYDAIPWVFADLYLKDPAARTAYHNRCVELYAKADLVCGISSSATADAVRFGYADAARATTIWTGVEALACEPGLAGAALGLDRGYFLNVSGDDHRKNPRALVAGFLASRAKSRRGLVLVVSNDAQTRFSKRLAAEFGDLRRQGVRVLGATGERALGSLYRDCDAFAYSSLYEGFGIPLVEALHQGKWAVTATGSSMGDVAGPALLAAIEDPMDAVSIAKAFDAASDRLDAGAAEPETAKTQARRFGWDAVADSFEAAAKTASRRPAAAAKKRLFWASPFPSDRSGIAFYSAELVAEFADRFEPVLVPNDPGSFVPGPGTGRFPVVAPVRAEILRANGGPDPLVFYHVGNSQFHVRLLDLLFELPGVVLLHDTFLRELRGFWLEHRLSGRAGRLAAAGRKLAKIDRLLDARQPTALRRAVSAVARLSWVRPAVLGAARAFRRLAAGPSRPAREGSISVEALQERIVAASRSLVVLGEHAKAQLATEPSSRRPADVVPLFTRSIGGGDKAALRAKYGIPAGAFVVTTTGFQAPVKMTEEIVRASAGLLDSGQAPAFIQVLGEFPDPSYRRRVEAAGGGRTDAAYVPGGFVDAAELRERLQLSDVAVFLRGWSTGGPSAGLNDALGAGLPCVVTGAFGFSEYPDSAVVKIDNAGLADALLGLYRAPAARAAYAEGAARFAAANSRPAVARRLGDLLERAALDSRGGARQTPRRTILVNGKFLVQGVTGVQRYARELTSALQRLPENPYRVLVVAPPGDASLQGFDGEVVRDDSWLRGVLWEQLRLPRLMRRYGADLLWSPCNTGPVAVRDQVVTLHDAAVYDGPEWYTPLFRRYYRVLFRLLGARVLRVLTDSKFSRFALIHHKVVQPERIEVLPAAVSPALAAAEAPAVVSARYVLAVGTRDPRKNIRRLIDAWALVPDAVKDGARLLIAGGRANSFASDRIASIPPDVTLLGYVEEAALAGLYQHAEAFVFPSLYEGFGLPPLEAMAAGAPVLASDIPVLREVCGDAAVYFDPTDPAAIAARISEVLTDETLRTRLRAEGRERAGLYTPEAAARKLLSVFRKVLQDPPESAVPESRPRVAVGT